MLIDRETVQRWKREFTGDAGLCDVDLWVYFAQRAAEQERAACKAAIESCVNELGFRDGSPGRWMADRCVRAISERTKEQT